MAANDLRALEDWAEVLLSRLKPAARRKLTTGIGRELRTAQQQRIADQRNPDGSAYAPRRPRKQLRGKRGRVKRMFAKLGRAKYLKVKSTPSSIVVGFAGNTARLARVHQYGLRDRAERGARQTQYATRRLLGLSETDMELIHQRLLEHLVE